VTGAFVWGRGRSWPCKGLLIEFGKGTRDAGGQGCSREPRETSAAFLRDSAPRDDSEKQGKRKTGNIPKKNGAKSIAPGNLERKCSGKNLNKKLGVGKEESVKPKKAKCNRTNLLAALAGGYLNHAAKIASYKGQDRWGGVTKCETKGKPGNGTFAIDEGTYLGTLKAYASYKGWRSLVCGAESEKKNIPRINMLSQRVKGPEPWWKRREKCRRPQRGGKKKGGYIVGRGKVIA